MDPCWAQHFKALADPSRLAILGVLEQEDCCAGALSERLQIEKTLLSHHLKILRTAGMICSRRDGKRVVYALAHKLRLPSSGKAIDLGCCQITFRTT